MRGVLLGQLGQLVLHRHSALAAGHLGESWEDPGCPTARGLGSLPSLLQASMQIEATAECWERYGKMLVKMMS